MHITKLAIAVLGLSSGALSYTIRAFTEPGCRGGARDIEVKNNSCRKTDVPQTKSFRVLGYGRTQERAWFYDQANQCSPYFAKRSFWADGGGPDFKKGNCITLDFTAKTYSSSYRPALPV